MSFIESLWVSLTQTHAMPHSTTFPSNTAPTMPGQHPPNSTSQPQQQDSEQLQTPAYFPYSNNGEYAYNCWPQQPQPQSPPHHATASLSLPAPVQPHIPSGHVQMQYLGPHQGIDGTWQQLCMIYDQAAVQTHNSYLSAAGVPFDLRSTKEMSQPLSPAEKMQTGDASPQSTQHLASSIVPTPEPTMTNKPGSAVFGLHTHHKSTSQKRNANMERLREVHGNTVVAPSGRHNANPTAQVNDRKGAIKARPGAKFNRHAAPTNTPPRLQSVPNKAYGKNKVNTSTASPWNRGKMPNSSAPVPPPKQAKGKQAVFPVPKRTNTHEKPKVRPTPARALGAWGNFEEHIAQDDNSVAAKSREILEQQKGSTLRPEFRETYKDQKGKKETMVHEGVSGRVGPVANESQNGDDTSKMEKKSPGDDAHVGDHGDDAELREGGVALSPSK